MRQLEGHRHAVVSLEWYWSPDGMLLASGGGDIVWVWNPQNGHLLRTFESQAGESRSLAWSPNGKKIASRSRDAVEVWDTQSGGLLCCHSYPARGDRDGFRSLAWSPPEGKLLATETSDGKVRVWNDQGRQLLSVLEGHIQTDKWEAGSLRWSPNGTLLASGGYDAHGASVYIWHTDTWERLAEISALASPNHITWHPFFPDVPDLVTSGEREEDLYIWRLDLKQLLYGVSVPQNGKGQPITRVPTLPGPQPTVSTLQVEDFDVFLCYNQKDKAAIQAIYKELKDSGLRPWVDYEQLRPGPPWQRILEQQIEHIKSAAVFIGPNDIGNWQRMEIEAWLREFVRRSCPVIPVVLSNVPRGSKLPLFLDGMTRVDFCQDTNPMQRLCWGIKGDMMGASS